MSEIEQKIDALGRTWEQLKAKVEEKGAEVERLGSESAETKATIAKMNDAMSTLEKALQEEQKARQRPNLAPGESKTSEQKLAERQAFLAFATQGQNGGVKTFSPSESKVLSVGDATTGGLFAMPEILSGMLRAVVEISPFRSTPPSGRPARKASASARRPRPAPTAGPASRPPAPRPPTPSTAGKWSRSTRCTR
jgi:HK97 family phage major capsid protein